MHKVIRVKKVSKDSVIIGYICIHLRMTGQLQTQLTDKDNKKHFTAKISFQNGEKLYFKDYIYILIQYCTFIIYIQCIINT